MNDHIIGEVKENGGSPKDAANCRPNSALKLQPIIWRRTRSNGFVSLADIPRHSRIYKWTSTRASCSLERVPRSK
eukprot:7902260-Pyramimonas_sp.AAC.1